MTTELSPVQIDILYQDGKAQVKAGDAVFDRYFKFHDIKEVLKALKLNNIVQKELDEEIKNLYKDGIIIDVEEGGDWDSAPKPKQKNQYAEAYKKAYNKAIFKRFRVPQREFIKLLNGKMYEAFIKPIPKPVYMRFGFSGGGKFSTEKMRMIHGSLPTIIEAHNDKLDHLIPMIIAFQMSIPELRKHFGKGNWKKVCSNSISRNKIIADYLNSMQPARHGTPTKEHITEALDLPSTLLKHKFTTNSLKFLMNNCKGKWAKYKELKEFDDLYSDTVRMMVRHENEDSLSKIDPTKWSIRRLNEEHERYTRLAYKATYSADQFAWADDVHIGPFWYMGYEVIPLFNAYDIGLEGNAMNHCVGSYADLSKRGDYLVFSVRKDGIRHSTIGMHLMLEYERRHKPLPPMVLTSNESISDLKVEIISKLIHCKVRHNQHYMKFNKPIPIGDQAANLPMFIEAMINN